MAKVFIEETTLSSIGDAIREKGGTSELISPLDMANAITNLPSGGSELPEEAFNITGNCYYRFSEGNWDWFIELYGNQIKTNEVSGLGNTFSNSKVEYIPFDINISSNFSTASQCFYFATELKEVPYIIGDNKSIPTSNYSNSLNLSQFFTACNRLREIPFDYFWKMVPNADYWESAQNYENERNSLFWFCYSLRELPDISMLGTKKPRSATIYSYLVADCYTLNKIVNIPITLATYTSNQFTNTFQNCYRLKEVKFQTNEDGTPKTANWGSQVIDLTKYVGYSNIRGYILEYNSGITEDKQVIDDATYQALKDDPDWFSTDINYSRYNHTSAVNTINSLPDCSATGTNTIKFKGAQGALTDGGAINTLTEEEIAVAIAKGWTVSLS